MRKKILTTAAILLGVLLLLSGVVVLLLSNSTFFGGPITWILCGCVGILMLYVIYVAVSRILDILRKRQHDEDIIEEQHLKNLFTNEIALKQQTLSMTAVNPAIQTNDGKKANKREARSVYRASARTTQKPTPKTQTELKLDSQDSSKVVGEPIQIELFAEEGKTEELNVQNLFEPEAKTEVLGNSDNVVMESLFVEEEMAPVQPSTVSTYSAHESAPDTEFFIETQKTAEPIVTPEQPVRRPVVERRPISERRTITRDASAVAARPVGKVDQTAAREAIEKRRAERAARMAAAKNAANPAPNTENAPAAE